MVEETSLERFMIKLNFCKIVHTKNLSNEKAENIINGMYTEFPYIKRQVNNNYSWSGFTSEYIKPFKIDHKSNKKFFDDDIYELENNNNFNSKVYKCTFVMYDRTNPKFVDIFILPSLNFICIIGTKKFINVPNKYLKDALKINDIEYEEINFSHSFLMWVLWKLSLGYSISSEINIDFFDDLKVGLTNPKNISNDTTPNSIKTTGGGNEFPSLPICCGLFNKKTLNYLKGEFQYNNKEFEVIY